MKRLMAAISVLAWVGCLENPYPDSRLGSEKNVKTLHWRPRGQSLPGLDLKLTRIPGGKLSVSGRGAPYDSIEFVIYVAEYGASYYPALGTPVPNRMEYHGIFRNPGGEYAWIADIPDATDGDDLRDYEAGIVFLKAGGGGKPPVGKWGGVYAGACTDPLRHTNPASVDDLIGYIDAEGYFAFRCFASERDPGSVTTGKIGDDSLISFLMHSPLGQYGGLSDTSDNLRFAWHGDSLAATFHLTGYSRNPDTSRIEAVRTYPRP
jgi:hypothetical protein